MRQAMTCLAGLVMLVLFSCSGHKNESELQSEPWTVTGGFRLKPGEKLHYRAFMGPIRLGDVQLQVAEKADTIRGKTAFCIRADGKSAGGFSWISVVEHHWECWVDTSSGLSLRTRREARENRYRVREEINYFPDSSLIISRNLNKGQLRRYPSRPGSMKDVVNLMWNLRYTDFEKFRPGDTLRYAGFHDGEWLSFRVCLAGKSYLGRGKNRKEVVELYPTGLATTFLRGENPARVWIEAVGSRRPLKAKLATYFGNFTVELVE